MKVILSLMLLGLFSCGEGNNTADTRSLISKTVVTIYGQTKSGYSSGGTGFSINAPSGKRYIVTNKHVCGLRDASNHITVKFPTLKRKYQRRVIEISTEHDLCLIESLPSFNKGLDVAREAIIGQTTYAVGHPKLYALTVSKGQLIEEASIMVQMSGAKKPTIYDRIKTSQFSLMLNVKKFKASRFVIYSRGGNSGSPIVNDQGQVISVLFAGNREDNMETYGVPLRFLKSFISGY